MNPQAQHYSCIEATIIQATKEKVKQYISRMHWPDDPEGQVEYVVDVGCGSGRATKEAVLAYIPDNVRVKITALDVSENMIRVAREKYSDPRIEFVVADIADDWHSFPPEWRGKFSKAFANYSLHWVWDLGVAMRNISNILQPGGYLFAQIAVQSVVFDVAKELRKRPKWSPFCKGKLPSLIECDSTTWEEQLLKSFRDAGLCVGDSETELATFEQPCKDSLKDKLRSVGLFYSNIPDALKEEYLEEYAQNIISILGKCALQGKRFSVLAKKK